MKIGGLQRFSLIDYPEKLSAVVFSIGCNFRCPYCHNPNLVDPQRYAESIAKNYIFDFLRSRKGALDALVITGGEPCLQAELIDFIKVVKHMGFLIKLDTNGSFPEVLEEIIQKGLVDYIAMDIKSPLERYSQVVCSPVDMEKIRQSIKLIINSGLSHEFRTTLLKSIINSDDIAKIAELASGAKLFALQNFVASNILNPKLRSEKPIGKEELEQYKLLLQPHVRSVIIR